MPKFLFIRAEIVGGGWFGFDFERDAFDNAEAASC